MTSAASSGVEVVARRDGEGVWRGILTHGSAPAELLLVQGWRATGPPEVSRADGGPLVLSYDVHPDDVLLDDVPSDEAAPAVPDTLHATPAAGIDLEGAARPGETAERVQRVAAYALVRSTRGLLATQFSQLTRAAGAWGPPGGGVDAGEHPAEAAVRECWEETGQVVTIGRLLDVASRHWVGRAPSGRLEDFHALALIYVGVCEAPSDPQVLDVGGTTSAAAWVPHEAVAGWPWAAHYAWIARMRPS